MYNIEEIINDTTYDNYCKNFIKAVQDKYHVEDLHNEVSQNPFPLEPVVIHDYTNLKKNEIDSLVKQFYSKYGVSFFYIKNHDRIVNEHIISIVAKQLENYLPLNFPIKHPMEGHPEAIKRFGKDDNTLKIYNLDIQKDGYVEVAETNKQFSLHNDGLGFAGKVENVIIFSESVPLWGGYTYFQNFLLLALKLAQEDWQSFKYLLLPDAIQAIRPRGKGAIRVQSPVFYLNDKNEPKVFYRVSSGEYKITWNKDNQIIHKIMNKLLKYAMPFSEFSSFINFSKRGFGCIIDNGTTLHGRTKFIEDKSTNNIRVLSRKWFMAEKKFTTYMHVPNLFVSSEYKKIFPDLNNDDLLNGEWLYNSKIGYNEKIL